MKHLIKYSIFLSIILSVMLSCGKHDGDDDDPSDTTTDELDLSYIQVGNHTTTPYIKGTFIDFWNKSGWTTAMWQAHMNEMKEIGIETLIIQFTAYNDEAWFDANNSFSTNTHAQSLSNLLDAANIYGIGVIVGLYFDDSYWNNTSNTAVLTQHVNKCKDIANDLWQKYKNKPAFKAWYIPQEPAPYYYQNATDRNILKNNLINPIAEYCKEISHKPVGISVFFNQNLTDVNAFGDFMSGIADAKVELFILQDGVGVDHCDLASVGAYYQKANDALYNNNYKGAFWADLEVFHNDNGQEVPEDINTVIQKLNAVKDKVSNIVIYQYYKDMSPSGPNAVAAQQLRNAYLNYLP